MDLGLFRGIDVTELLGVEPYADAAYYAGFRIADLEIGLDPHGRSSGPLVYWEVSDIKASLQQLLDAVPGGHGSTP